jgi:cobalt-zinc-cadmium efflux system outer membrane protein
LSLTGALARARARRPVVAEAAALVAEARGNTRASSTITNPSLSYSATGDSPRRHAIVDQPLDWLLRHGADRAAGRAGEQRAAADSVALMAGLAREVRIAFYDALAGRESLRLTEDGAALADSLAEAAETRLKAGDISVLERDQVVQEAARARYAVSLAREEAGVAAAAFARAIGGADATAVAPVGALDQGLDRYAGALAAAPDDLPAVRAAVADSAAAAEAARSARIAQLPLPDLQVGAEWKNVADPSEGTTSVVGLAIPLPLWNHGGGAAVAARARADRDAAAAAEARLEAAAAVQERSVRLDGAAARARFDRDSLFPAARALRQRALAAYRAGETGVLPVFDAMRGERDAALTLVRDLVAFQDALAERNALLGRTD